MDDMSQASNLGLSDAGLLKTGAYIDGKWVEAVSGETFTVDNPVNGDTLATLAYCGADETKRAVDAANAAQPAWAAKTPKERAKHLRDLFNVMMANQADLARILTLEQGKPLAESMGEIAYGANYIEWFAEEAKRIYGEVMTQPSPDKRVVVIRQPVGVAALITPWNFPNAMLTRKIAPALAAGCTVVCKPASETPLSALAIAELCDRAGIPPGVVNVVCGDTRAIGGELTSNPIVKKLSFTGSTQVGKILTEQCVGTLKRLSMELGGNAPFIVFDDADLDAAVEGAMICKFRNNGQTCVCANRIYVQSGIYDAFAERFAQKVSQMKVGDGFDAETDFGPLITDKAVEKVEEHIADARSKGGDVVLGGDRHEKGGTFFQPTIITGATQDMVFAQEETFGPMAPLFKFDTEEEVLGYANDTIFGLAAYFYARDVGRITRVNEGLEYGIVGVNTGIISTEAAPFGGVKQSGLGREGSRHGIEDFLELKYTCLAI